MIVDIIFDVLDFFFDIPSKIRRYKRRRRRRKKRKLQKKFNESFEKRKK